MPVLAETHRQFEARTGQRILERYGMTETGMNTSSPYAGERMAGTVGLPLPGVSLEVRDPHTDRRLPPGEVGMLQEPGINGRECLYTPGRSSLLAASEPQACHVLIP